VHGFLALGSSFFFLPNTVYETGSSPPPRRASLDLLTRAIAYRIQERALGRLSTSTGRLLDRVADDIAMRRPAKIAPIRKLLSGPIFCTKRTEIVYIAFALSKVEFCRGRIATGAGGR
jgi:hypothetical protein